MAIRTIALSGGETAVTELDGSHAHIWNNGVDTIYASKISGISAGADGVISIPAGQNRTLTGISRTIYLLGTGSAEIQSNDYPNFSFSTASGGSAVDVTARAAIGEHERNSAMHVSAAEKAAWNAKADLSDIPTELPANGGNADTLGGLAASDFLEKSALVQFSPFNMKYYALGDRICLFSDDDDVTRGIFLRNNSSQSVIVCLIASAMAEGPICQYGYGTSTYPQIQNEGVAREWFTEQSVPTSPTLFTLEVPSGKLGYFGFYSVSASSYVTVHDIRCPYADFF